MAAGSMKTVLLIIGMRGNACREVIATALERIHGVRDAQVNLYRGQAIVSHDPPCQAADLIAAIRRAGYGASLAPRQVSV